MRIKRRFLSVASVFLCLILILSGCGGTKSGSSTSSTKPVTITFLHKWPEDSNMAFFKQVIKSFEAKHPNVTIKMEAVGDQDIKDKLRVMVGGTCPDIFFSWSGEFANKFVRAGKVLDFTPYFTKDSDWQNSFLQAALKRGSFNDKYYGIPMRLDLQFFIYNKKIFQNYGLSVPKTWNEFLNVCKTLKQHNVTPILFGNQQAWAGAHYITALNSMYVPASVKSKDDAPATGSFTNENYLKALNTFKNLETSGYMNTNVNSTTFYQVREIFYTGKGGMFLDVLSDFSKYEQNMGKGNWGYFRFPIDNTGSGDQNFIVGGADMFMVSKQCKNPDVAVEFLKFMTNKENAANFAKTTGYPIPVKGAVNKQNSLSEVVDAMNYISNVDTIEEWLDTSLESRVADKYLTSLQDIFNNKSTSDALKEIQSTAKTVQSDYK
ncbi:MAG TPA: extracellular solute-binding protein [Clostridia bacterium]|nr:extracellular solute-binding protein [Clostridia bacterium]